MAVQLIMQLQLTPVTHSIWVLCTHTSVDTTCRALPRPAFCLAFCPALPAAGLPCRRLRRRQATQAWQQ